MKNQSKLAIPCKTRGLVLLCSLSIPFLAVCVILGFLSDLTLIVALLCLFGIGVSEGSSSLSRKCRIVLLLCSFFLPFIAVWAGAITFQHPNCGFSFGYIGGCLGLGTMGVCLVADRYWWLVASFLFPVMTIYGFWGSYLYSLHRWRVDDPSEILIFAQSMYLAIFGDRPEPDSFMRAHGLAWGLAGLLLSLVVFGFCRFILFLQRARAVLGVKTAAGSYPWESSERQRQLIVNGAIANDEISLVEGGQLFAAQVPLDECQRQQD